MRILVIGGELPIEALVALKLALEDVVYRDVHVDPAPFVQQAQPLMTEVEIKQCLAEYVPLATTFNRRSKGEKRRNRADRWGRGVNR